MLKQHGCCWQFGLYVLQSLQPNAVASAFCAVMAAPASEQLNFVLVLTVTVVGRSGLYSVVGQ